ncbi:MAG: tetratricopeptide repeat protein [Nitrospinae bacterium]|nr:tetratricopeptide repeat protein [Nitrospinota bacterium]
MTAEDIKGIYYETKKMEAGTMATRRVHDTPHDLHYYAKTNTKGDVDLFYLKPDGTPTSIVVDTVAMDAFKERFKDCSTHQCEFKPKTEDDKKKEASDKKANMAQIHLEKKEYHAAAFEFGQAIKIDEKNIVAHLGKGKAHMELGEVDKAKETFEKLSTIDTIYDKDNKHLFNEYGIELRRGKMYDLAVTNYTKAIEIDPDDEALYFNMARALHENGNASDAVKCLEQALKIKPDFNEAKLLHGVITKSAAGK